MHLNFSHSFWHMISLRTVQFDDNHATTKNEYQTQTSMPPLHRTHNKIMHTKSFISYKKDQNRIFFSLPVLSSPTIPNQVIL